MRSSDFSRVLQYLAYFVCFVVMTKHQLDVM